MRFTLVHHGEVQSGPAVSDAGLQDPVLTARGRRQAAALASALNAALERGVAYDALLTSPLRAARATAEALDAVLDAGEPQVTPELSSPGLEDGIAEEPGALPALQERAWSLLAALKQRYEPASHLILVTHELPIRALVCRALSMELTDRHRFVIEPASMTTIEFRLQGQRERIIIASLNETCHLDEVGRADHSS